jgi:predicted ATPase
VDIVGRAGEQARIDAFVEAVPSGAQALLLRGEPGIGKTTLWRRGLLVGHSGDTGHI